MAADVAFLEGIIEKWLQMRGTKDLWGLIEAETCNAIILQIVIIWTVSHIVTHLYLSVPLPIVPYPPAHTRASRGCVIVTLAGQRREDQLEDGSEARHLGAV